jgi:CRP-like cAMP-binding protein
MARTTDPVIKMLAALEVFTGLSPKQLKQVRETGKLEQVGPGVEIVAEGSKGRRLYLVLEGDACVTIGGKQVNTMGPGACFGEISALDGRPRAATVTALSPMRLLSIADFNLKALLRADPDFAISMLKALSGMVRGRSTAVTH